MVIRPWYEVYCDGKGSDDSPCFMVNHGARTRREAAKQARSDGWVLRKDEGWYCPSCITLIRMNERELARAAGGE